MFIRIYLFVALSLYGVLFGSCGNANPVATTQDIVETDSATNLNSDTVNAVSLVEVTIEEAVDSTDYENWESDRIEIDKGSLTLKLYDKEGKLRMKFPVGVAINYGNKRRKGDHRTSEGDFKISVIQRSSGWTHDFRDGKGVIKGAYGPWFIRLKTPITNQIGIHGTHLPESIGTRCSEGCIRMNNDDLLKLREKVFPGLKVRILPGPKDEEVNLREARR